MNLEIPKEVKELLIRQGFKIEGQKLIRKTLTETHEIFCSEEDSEFKIVSYQWNEEQEKNILNNFKDFKSLLMTILTPQNS